MVTRDKRFRRGSFYCSQCKKTQTFILIANEWRCAGDETQKKDGCGKILRDKADGA